MKQVILAVRKDQIIYTCIVEENRENQQLGEYDLIIFVNTYSLSALNCMKYCLEHHIRTAYVLGEKEFYAIKEGSTSEVYLHFLLATVDWIAIMKPLDSTYFTKYNDHVVEVAIPIERYLENMLPEWLGEMGQEKEHIGGSLDLEDHACITGPISNGKSKNWLVVSENSYSPSIIVGLEHSLCTLREQGKINYKIIGYERFNQEIAWADCILFVRTMDQEKRRYLDYAKALGKQTLYYTDDSLYEIPEYVKSSKRYTPKQLDEGLKYFVENTDGLIGCSEWLVASYCKAYQCQGISLTPTVRIPNILKKDKMKETVVIGFAGNQDYEFFLERMRPVFVELHDKYSKQVQFEFFGPKVSFIKEIDGIYFPRMAYTYYEMLVSRRNWDIGIAYLEESEFTNKKFYNKYLEYGRFGICGIYSDITLFRRIVRDGENGILVKNTHRDWINQLEQLINQKQLCHQIGLKAQVHVGKVFSGECGAREIERKMKGFI